MRFEGSARQYGSAGWCSECTWSAPLHHPCCPRRGESATALDREEWDYSHLIGPPAMEQYKVRRATQFSGLLTDYDRILLRFGMHILW